MQCVLIIDFSHLFHLARAAALTAGPDYDLAKVTIENVVGKLRTIKRNLAKSNIKGYDLVFAEDRPALRKLALLPGYRANRKDLSGEKEVVKKYLLDNGQITRFCHSEGQEGDDVIASLVQLALTTQDLNIIISSSDRDLWQMIQPRVQLYNPIKQEFVTEEEVERIFQCRPIHIPLHKALWGDSGDSVPNVMPRTQKYLLPIINKTDGTLEAFRTRIERTEDKFYLPSKCYEMYLNALPEIERNYALVKLNNQCEVIWE